MTIRQPIVTVVGHVDSGKTSILDCFRGSCVAEEEAGGITQKISFTLFPSKNIKKSCVLIDKQEIKLDIPGFLFIDTPGHAAFTNLRKRGGSLADLAILVIDINEGIKPQTAEAIQILKANKVPFVIAANKTDNISGWRKQSENLKESIEMQAVHVKQIFDERYFTLQGALHMHGFEAEIYYNISDFTKKVAIVPCSARTKEGIQELLMMLCGLSQKFLKEKLNLGEKAKGVVLEVKKEKSMNLVECIIYDGILSMNNKIAIATFQEPIITRIRAIHEIQPLYNVFKPVKKVTAATGIRLQITEKEDEILPGMPLMLFQDNIDEIKKEFNSEITENIQTDKKGIIVKADSLGSLEALLFLLRQQNIKVLKASIGSIKKSDIISAKANLQNAPLDAFVIGFNVSLDEDLERSNIDVGNVKIITDDVVYKLIEKLQEEQAKKQKEIEREKLLKLATIAKIEVLHNFVFNNKPAIFGVKILAGKIKPGAQLINSRNEEIDKIKKIQSENKSVEEATSRMEVAISLPKTSFDRQLKDENILYTNLSENQFRGFKKNKDILMQEEIAVLQEIAQIKRKEKPTWGI